MDEQLLGRLFRSGGRVPGVWRAGAPAWWGQRAPHYIPGGAAGIRDWLTLALSTVRNHLSDPGRSDICAAGLEIASETGARSRFRVAPGNRALSSAEQADYGKLDHASLYAEPISIRRTGVVRLASESDAAPRTHARTAAPIQAANVVSRNRTRDYQELFAAARISSTFLPLLLSCPPLRSPPLLFLSP